MKNNIEGLSKNILLFGGAGFIGYHLDNLINNTNGFQSFIFDIQKSSQDMKSFEFIDVRKKITTSYSPNSSDVIINMAAVHRTPGHESHEYFETNLLGAKNVCNYAREHNIDTIVFTSSIAVYGTHEKKKFEVTTPMPDIPYGISKLSAEYIHKLWQQEDPKKRRLIIVRPGVVFGNFEKGNFTRLINSIAKRSFFYPGRNDTIKACIYVKDLVQAIFQMVNEENLGVSTFNMTYEPAPSIDKICSIISESGRLPKVRIKLPASILLFVSKTIYFLTNKEGVHPDRVKKLMISNNISGTKLNNKYFLQYGLEEGISDWMRITNFHDTKIIE